MKTRRILMSVAGVLIGGMFAGLFQFIAFGVDPFQCFVNGAHAMIPISFGTLYVILNALLLTFALVADRHYIGLATLINMFLLGYVVEFTYKTLCSLIPAPGMALRIILVPVALLGLSATGSLYITADLGVSTYDAVALIISETWHKMPGQRAVPAVGQELSGIDRHRRRGHHIDGLLHGPGDRMVQRAYFPAAAGKIKEAGA